MCLFYCSFLQATVRALDVSQQPCVRISGVRAVCGFCDHLSGKTESFIGKSCSLCRHIFEYADQMGNVADDGQVIRRSRCHFYQECAQQIATKAAVDTIVLNDGQNGFLLCKWGPLKCNM